MMNKYMKRMFFRFEFSFLFKKIFYSRQNKLKFLEMKVKQQIKKQILKTLELEDTQPKHDVDSDDEDDQESLDSDQEVCKNTPAYTHEL